MNQNNNQIPGENIPAHRAVNDDDRWDELRSENRKQSFNANSGKSPKKGSGLKIFIIIAAVFLALIVIIGIVIGSGSGRSSLWGSNDPEYDLSVPYIAQIDITGTISDSSSSLIYEPSSYNQTWLLNTIDGLIEEDNNEGILLYLDTPGGSVYATDEVYLKLMEYKKKTGNPVYAAMGPTCASGGYYISCAADRSYANRNGITGSIGVTMGTSIDISKLLEDYGIKTTTLVSGRNKAMGSMYDPLTEEQLAIYQSIIDESYEQFTSIVAKGRNMDIAKVKELADGRVYTAKQAAKNGLIDGIKTLQDTIITMQKDIDMEDCPVYEYAYHESVDLYSMLFGLVDKFGGKSSQDNDGNLASAIKLAENGTYGEPYYLMN